MFFSNTHWPQLTAPFYSILFETSICHFNSSTCSPIIPDEVREHLTRDQRPFLHPESLQIFRFTDPWRCFFSSVHSCSTGFRSENTWREIRDHSFIQNHSRSFRFTDPWRCFFSSVHSCSTGFRSEDWNGSRSLVVCSVTRFCVVFVVCVWIIVQFEDPDMAHYKISNRVSHLLIFYLLVFDRIHDTMCLNKIFMTSSRNIGPQQKQYCSIFHCTHGILFIPVFTKPILSVCC